MKIASDLKLLAFFQFALLNKVPSTLNASLENIKVAGLIFALLCFQCPSNMGDALRNGTCVFKKKIFYAFLSEK